MKIIRHLKCSFLKKMTGKSLSCEKKIVFFRTIRYSFSNNYYIKGISCKPDKAETVSHEHYKDLFENILNNIDYHGLCCIDYKLVDDEVKLFEINPRYGFSLIHFLDEALIIYRNLLNKVS